jgi:hypothetical protein
MTMIENVIRRFAPSIEIRVSPEKFQFTHLADQEMVQTFLLLHDRFILAIGETSFEGAAKCTRIDLFEPLDSKLDKQAYLNSFIRFGIQKVLNRRWMIRPKILFRNTKSLHLLLNGYQNTILRQAAIENGACECTIEGEPVE